VFKIKHPDDILTFINKGIVHGMDLVAPVKSITVKDGALLLYLRPDTLELMKLRDSLGRGPKYKSVRNRVSALVRRNKELYNLARLAESNNSPTVLWETANAAIGKPRQPLPGLVKDAEGNDTVGNLEAANVVNSYVEKVRKIRAGSKGRTRGVKNCCSQPSNSFGTKLGGKIRTS
jgi:hypothetical protein